MNSAAPSRWTDGSMRRRVARRYAAERRFKALGFAAVALSLGFLAFLLVTILLKGAGGNIGFSVGRDGIGRGERLDQHRAETRRQHHEQVVGAGDV